MLARTYACNACGGHVDEHARRCRYCAAPVATVRCACCFQMNVPDVTFCSGCGRQLGLEPVGQAGTLPCPLCKQALIAYREDAGVLLDCAACGGQFVEHTLFREMLERHSRMPLPDGGGPASVPSARGTSRPDPRTNYIPCPECAALMNRKNFGASSGVVVDVCKKHGTWFDEGELPRVLSFVATGGMERARKREEEAAALLRREATAASASMASASVAHGVHLGGGLGGDEGPGIVELFLHLLG